MKWIVALDDGTFGSYDGAALCGFPDDTPDDEIEDLLKSCKVDGYLCFGPDIPIPPGNNGYATPEEYIDYVHKNGWD